MVEGEAFDEDESLDDGFPYEHIGNEIEMRWTQSGWIAPTPFMVVSLKETLRLLISSYGRRGHPLLREIGDDFSFVESMGLAAFCRLRDWAGNALPDDLKHLAEP